MLCDVDVGVVWMLSSLTENSVSHEYTCIGRHNSKKVDILKSVIPREEQSKKQCRSAAAKLRAWHKDVCV